MHGHTEFSPSLHKACSTVFSYMHDYRRGRSLEKKKNHLVVLVIQITGGSRAEHQPALYAAMWHEPMEVSLYMLLLKMVQVLPCCQPCLNVFVTGEHRMQLRPRVVVISISVTLLLAGSVMNVIVFKISVLLIQMIPHRLMSYLNICCCVFRDGRLIYIWHTWCVFTLTCAQGGFKCSS